MIQREPVTPSHYYLSDESWDEILQAYRNGATARDLAVKWKVSIGSVYYRAGLAGFGKKTHGDERARAHARAVEEREPTRGPVDWQTYKDQTAALFCDAEPDPEGPADPAVLARQAMTASGRAMREGMWPEAKALSGLAESYARLAERMGGTAYDPERLPLQTLLAVLENRDGLIKRRCDFDPFGPYDAETEMKKQHLRRVVAGYREEGYPEIVVEAVVRDMLNAGPPKPSKWPDWPEDEGKGE
jgi:hypothetical protein